MGSREQQEGRVLHRGLLVTGHIQATGGEPRMNRVEVSP